MKAWRTVLYLLPAYGGYHSMQRNDAAWVGILAGCVVLVSLLAVEKAVLWATRKWSASTNVRKDR